MAFPTLGITSPLMHDHHGFHAVSDAQKALKHAGYLRGAVDGVYGPLTGAAAQNAKLALGYPTRQCDKRCGATLMAYLTGKAKPNAVMRLRAAQRRRHNAVNGKRAKMRAKLVRVLISQVGETEHPADSNRSKFSLWFHMIGPWCAMFVSWGMAQIGYGKQWRYSYCPTIYAMAHENKSGLQLVHPEDALPGDQFLADWDRNGVFDHIGTLTTRVANRKFGTIEGNTGPANLSNGGKVLQEERTLDMGNFAFVRFAF